MLSKVVLIEELKPKLGYTKRANLQRVLVLSNYIHVQLFRQRLSPKNVKAYAAMSIGIMSSISSALLELTSRFFSNQEGEKLNTCVCAVSFHPAETPSGSINNKNNVRHCGSSFFLFVRQPFRNSFIISRKLTSSFIFFILCFVLQ